MIKKIFLLGLSLIAVTLIKSQDTTAIRFSKNIHSESLSNYLHKLASDEFEGRETGKQGQKLAAAYIAEHFKSCGIPELPGNKGYFQTIPLTLKQPGGGSISVGSKKYEFLKDYYYFQGFDDFSMNCGEMVFLGYGISDEKYNDYKDIDVKDKTLIILDGEPFDKSGFSLITGEKTSSQWSTNLRKKVYAAKEYHPALILVVVDSIEKAIGHYSHYIEKPALRLSNAQKSSSTPVIYISREMAEELMKKKEIEKAKEKISRTKQPFHQVIKTTLAIDVQRKSDQLEAENVLGYVEGTDLKDELVIITAHYDHLGTSEGKIYYGADDDGSGTSAVMELAKAFSLAKKEGKGPRRSMLFMPVSGEEKGLLGSEYYSSNPVFPLANTVVDLNIDMIGRLDDKHKDNPDYVYVIGSDKLSTQLHKINEDANKTYLNLELDYTYNSPNDPNRYYYRSDHYNFAKNNIPVIFYFNGVHADYHKATDTVDKINFEKMEKITRLVFFTAWDLANRDERIKVDLVNDFKNDK